MKRWDLTEYGAREPMYEVHNGDWVLFEDYAHEISVLRNDLTAARLERDEARRQAERLNVRVWALATLLYPYVPPRSAVAGDIGWVESSGHPRADGAK